MGAAISLASADAGADLLLHYRTHGSGLQALAEDCRHLGRRVEVERSDFLGRPGSCGAEVDSDEAGFITGETIHVDGGMTRRMPLQR